MLTDLSCQHLISEMGGQLDIVKLYYTHVYSHFESWYYSSYWKEEERWKKGTGCTVLCIVIYATSTTPPEVARDYLHGTGKFTVEQGIISPVHDSYNKEVSP